METQYVKLTKPEEQCPQYKFGKTPCFHNMKRDGVDCDLCPVQLFMEQNADKVSQMFHNGTCLMDERNPANISAIARYKSSGVRQEAIPLGFTDELVVKVV